MVNAPGCRGRVAVQGEIGALITYSEDPSEARLQRLEHENTLLRREVARLAHIEKRYISMCHAARATATSWLDTLACDGDPDVATSPVVSAVAAS